MRSLFSHITALPKRLGQSLIVLYQRTLSPDHGFLSVLFRYRVCRFNPTCSEYAYLALDRVGLIKGSWMTLKRLLRCHPWSDGGFDPPFKTEERIAHPLPPFQS